MSKKLSTKVFVIFAEESLMKLLSITGQLEDGDIVGGFTVSESSAEVSDEIVALFENEEDLQVDFAKAAVTDTIEKLQESGKLLTFVYCEDAKVKPLFVPGMKVLKNAGEEQANGQAKDIKIADILREHIKNIVLHETDGAITEISIMEPIN
jgi:hypothetical protein